MVVTIVWERKSTLLEAMDFILRINCRLRPQTREPGFTFHEEYTVQDFLALNNNFCFHTRGSYVGTTLSWTDETSSLVGEINGLASVR
jgi:hypothetical protein